MCGIGGILRVWPADQREVALRTPHAQSIPEAWLDVLDDSIKYRGPDGQGRFRDRVLRADGCVVDVAFVHRRLSIIDHAGGHQPMVSQLPLPEGGGRGVGPPDTAPDTQGLPRLPLLFHGKPHDRVEYRSIARPNGEGADQVCVVFNGCIYNHRELRAELQRAGHVFTTDHSDTEVLVHGWREWGIGLRDRLNGMFAAVLWDSASGEMVYLRDDFGEKPLAAWEMACARLGMIETDVKCIAFASTSAALARLAHQNGLRGPNLATCTTLRGWMQFGWNQLGPWEGRGTYTGSVDSFMSGTGHSSPRWFESLNPSGHPLSMQETDGLLRAAVRSRLESDVPLACFLSGGIDSALVARYAAEAHPDLRAFTVRMPDASFDESAAAAQTAAHLNVRHTILGCDPHPAEDLQRLIHQLGEPFGDSSLLPSAWVARAAKREVGVALTGDGGDDLFLGYQRQAALPWLRRLQLLGNDALDSLAALAAGIGRRRREFDKLARLIDAARFGSYKDLVAIFPPPLCWDIGMVPRGNSGWGGNSHFGMTMRAHADAPDDLFTNTALRFDRMFYLPLDLMRKADTASMSVALESRAPFLETAVASAAMNAPIRSLMPHGQRKGLLRQVARKYLPAEIVDRPKMGFAIPIGEWFRSDYGGLRTMLLDHLNSTEPFGPPSLGIDLNMAFIRQMLDEHLGTGPSGVVKRDHSQRLYMLLVLSIWAKWVGGLR